MKVTGDPGAKVSLVVVDNAVYLLNRDRLTQRKVCVFDVCVLNVLLYALVIPKNLCFEFCFCGYAID